MFQVAEESPNAENAPEKDANKNEFNTEAEVVWGEADRQCRLLYFIIIQGS